MIRYNTSVLQSKEGQEDTGAINIQVKSNTKTNTKKIKKQKT
jgi:hypothetical protein